MLCFKSSATSVAVAPTAAPSSTEGEEAQQPSSSQAAFVPPPETAAVRVVVRVRPMITREAGSKASTILAVNGPTSIKVLDDPAGKNKASEAARTFAFDAVMGQQSTQLEAYNATGHMILGKVLQGYNGCIFAYGQTGSGKTFSMEGESGTAKDDIAAEGGAHASPTHSPTSPASPDAFVSSLPAGAGVTPRICEELFALLHAKAAAGTGKDGSRWVFGLTASFVEVYMEKISDLLSPPSSGKGSEDEAAIIRQRPDGSIFLEGVAERVIRTPSDIQALLVEGAGRRTKGETAMNAASSRSHAVLSLSLTMTRDDTNATSGNVESFSRSCKLHLVDLAGSERADATGATGSRLAEGAKINLSLTALGGVINALTTPGRTHIPYRDSKLTRLLQDSIGGNAFTCMLSCVSPASINYDETLSTLRFAERAKKVKNVARVGVDATAARISALVDETKGLRVRIAALESALVRRGANIDASALQAEEESGVVGAGGAGAPPAAAPPAKSAGCVVM